METFYPCIDHAVPDVSGLSWPFPFPRPQPIKINGVLLVGDKSSEELGLASADDMKKVKQEISGMGEQITRAVEAATAAEQAAREATEAAQGATQTATEAKVSANTATKTANEAKEAAEGKADADELSYLIVNAVAGNKTLPGYCFPITLQYEGVAYSCDALVSEEEAHAAGDMFLVDDSESFFLVMVLKPETESAAKELIEVAFFNGDGVYMNGEASVKFGGENPVHEVSPTLAVSYALTNRAVNSVSVAAATPITLTMPDAVSGHSRNLYARIDLSNLASAPYVTFQNADGTLAVTEAKGGTWPALVAGKDNLISLKEVAAGVFTVEAAAYERISPPTP